MHDAKDGLGEKMKLVRRARENIYFAEKARQLIKRLRTRLLAVVRSDVPPVSSERSNPEWAHLAGKPTLSEEMMDQTLADSFPASDPPSWIMGRERHPELTGTTN